MASEKKLSLKLMPPPSFSAGAPLADVFENNKKTASAQLYFSSRRTSIRKMKHQLAAAPLLQPSPPDALFYTMQVNSRPGNPTPIFVSIGNVSHLTLNEANFPEIFRLINQHTLNTPYPLGDSPISYSGLVAYRPNHNGTHSARQMAYLDALFDFIKNKGSKASVLALSHCSEEEILNLRLGACFLRAGRVDETNFSGGPNPDDYRTRSLLIYEQYAKQLGVCPAVVDWVKSLIDNSCKPVGVRDPSMDLDPKNKFGFEALSLCHELDLIRCFDSNSMQRVIKNINNGLDYFVEDDFDGSKKNRSMNQLLQYAKDACRATGSKITFDHAPWNLGEFVRCSTDGMYCLQALRNIPIPKWA